MTSRQGSSYDSTTLAGVEGYKAKFVDGGAEVTPMSADRFEAFVKTEVRKFAAIIKDAGIKAE